MVLIPESTQISLYRDIPFGHGIAAHWDSRAQQEAFYASKLITSSANCYYQRKHNGRTLIEWPISQVEQANYFTFRNPDFENVLYYCRIIECEYINNMTTEIQWEIDPWETYWDNLRYTNCFVLREQPSQAVWSKAVSGKPSVVCKNDYYMTSPENLDVNKSLEKIYSGDFTSVGGDVSYYPNMPNDSDYDLVLCLKVALPAEFDKSYALDDDPDEGSKILFSCLTGADGFSDIYAQQLEKVPVTCVYLYCNMDRNEVPRFTADGAARMRAILNELTIGDSSHTIVGMYALPRYWVARICDKYASAVSDTSLTVETRTYDPAGRTASITIPDYSGYHPKLDMYPFRYLRVVSPDGNAKEYNYERFATDSANFYIETTMGGTPTQSCVPYHYASQIDKQQFSYQERIEFAGVPDCPYTIDNYLAWLSQQYSKSFGGFTMGSFAANTIGTAANLLSAVSGFGSVTTDIVQGANSPTTTTSYSINPMQVGQSFGNIAQQFYSGGTQVATIAEADRVRSGKDNANQSRFSAARRAFVGDEYHPGNGAFSQYLLDSGTSGANSGCRAFRFRFIQVDLREDIKKAYSDYLMTYGCTANRFGIPYVCSAIAGETDPNKLPSYVTLNGETFTYVKTSGISVFGVEYEMANRIADMFDNGVRFLKGSEL